MRPWDLAGTADQPFYIGSGFNFRADKNVWLEIIYSVEGAQILNTRNFLHDSWGFSLEDRLQHLEELTKAGEGVFAFGDMLPETSLSLKIEKHSYSAREGEPLKYYRTISLTISADIGAVFGFSAPGNRFIEIKLDLEDPMQGLDFMRDFVHELDAVYQGKHPDPLRFPPVHASGH